MANDELTIPISIRKTIGISPLQIAVGIGVTGLYTFKPLASGGQSLSEVLHGAGIYGFGFVLIVLLVISLLVNSRCTLKIDQTGVDLSVRKARYHVVWPDIAHVTPIKSGLRIELKGRPDDEGVTIPKGLGLDADKLTAVLRDGMERWGAAPASANLDAGRTLTPPGGGKRQKRAALLRAMVLFGVVFGCLLVGLTIWQVADYMKDAELQTHGVRMEGSIVRIYTGDCGKSSCSINLEYTYTSPGGKTVHGFDHLTGDNHLDDPDYRYAKSHSSVPIAVDSIDPDVSELNFDDRVFTRDPLKVRLEVAAIVLPIFLAIPGVIILFLYWSYRKAEKSNAQSPWVSGRPTG